jgi:nickel/cobalt exporter
MIQLVIGSVLLSLLHALIPNHWLPLLAIGRKENWNMDEVTRVAFLCGLVHAFSTISIGLCMGLLGWRLSADFSSFTKFIAPAILILLGVYFIYQHHRHHHFHLHQLPDTSLPKAKTIAVLLTSMFFSPCLEIEGYFLVAGTKGILAISLVSIIYLILSIVGMILWVQWTFKKSMNFNWHALEHNTGIITGATLITTGIITFFIH